MLLDIDRQQYKDSNCVVTGGTGMIGAAVCKLLLDAGANVKSVSLDRLHQHEGVKYIYGDLRHRDFVFNTFKHADYVFHVAGIKGSPVVTRERPASFFVPMLTMNAVVLSAIYEEGARGVYVSSIGAYAQTESGIYDEDVTTYGAGPMDLYPGWAKRMGEMICRAYQEEAGKISFGIVRPSNVYGPGDNFDIETAMVIPSLMGKALRGDDPVMVWGRGEEIRDFVYSEDVALGILRAGYKDTEGFVNLGGFPCSVADLCFFLHQATGVRFQFDLSETRGQRVRILNPKKAKNVLGWKAETKLQDGLKKTWDWFSAHAEEYRLKKNFFKKEGGNGSG